MNYIVWQKPDGSLAITIPADPTADIESVAAHAQNADPSLSDCVRLDNVESLPNRRFRNCWRYNEKIEVDIDLAKQQVLAEVRMERNKLLDASDKEAARLADIGTPEEQAKLKVYRQQLRDLPVVIETELMLIEDVKDLENYRVDLPRR